MSSGFVVVNRCPFSEQDFLLYSVVLRSVRSTRGVAVNNIVFCGQY
jgi:hypothetical protein